MKVVVVGDNQKDREKVARVIKDKYKGLAEMNEGLRDNKRYLENDLALKMEQIVALKATFKCYHCGFVATTKAEAEAHFGEGEGFPALCVEWTTMDDTERGQAYQELRMDLDQARSDETKLEEQIVALREVGGRLRDYLTESGGNERYCSVDIPDEIWVPFIEALRGEEVKK